MIEIRPVETKDLDFVAGLEKKFFSDAWTAESLAEEIRFPFSKSYILLEDGTPRSYGLFRLTAGEGEVLRIGTSPEHRRKGFARALLERFLEDAPETVFLEVREGNAPARGLYESVGFQEISKRPRYYRDPVEDAVIYEKK